MIMKTNNAQGRTICIGITAYMVAKAFINLFIGGFSFSGLVSTLFTVAFAVVIGVLMFTGLQYVNFGVAGYLALGFMTHLPNNIMHIGSNWFYLLEGFVDVGCAVILLILPVVREHFTNKWSELSDLLKS